MSPIEIRPMAAREIETVVGVWERSRWEAQRWLEERMGYSHEQNLEHFRAVVARENQVWLAVEDGEIVGLLALGSSQIDQLFVEPRRQGKGVGTRLLERAKELAPRGLTLFTHQRNQRARAFYEGWGFRAVSFGVSPAPESEPDVKYLWEPGSDPAASGTSAQRR